MHCWVPFSQVQIEGKQVDETNNVNTQDKGECANTSKAVKQERTTYSRIINIRRKQGNAESYIKK